MGKSIKQRYDDNPTAGDNPATDYLIPSDDGTGNPLTLDKSQFSGAVDNELELNDRLSAAETGSPSPISTSTYWAATLPADRFIVSVYVQNYTGTAYAITEDTDTTPTYPGDFTTSYTPPHQYDLVTNTARTLRFYQWTSGSGVEEILDVHGLSGISVIPSTSAPVITTFNATDTSGSTIVPIELLAVGVNTPTSYIISTSSTKPLPSDSGWLALPVTSYDTGSYATHTLYAWVKDSEGVVSSGSVTSVVTSAASVPTILSFEATLNFNTLEADINAVIASSPAYTHYQITENDAVAPTLGDGDWVSGSVPTTYTIQAGYSTAPTAVTLRLWIKNATDVSAAVDSVDVTPTDTVGPIAITDFQLSATSTTEIILLFTETTDVASGVAQYDLYNSTNDTLIASNISPSQSITGLTPGTSYSWYIRAIDNHNNYSTSNVATETTSGIAFYVQHGETSVEETGASAVIVSATMDNSIVLVNNNRYGTGGWNSEAIAYGEGDDFSVAAVQASSTKLDIYREPLSSTINTRIAWSVWEDESTSEFVVRHRASIDLDGTTTNGLISGITGVVDEDACVPFITGILNDASSNDADSTTAIAWMESSSSIRVYKGTNQNNVTVYITLVEFIGSGWTVLHGDSGSVSADTGSIDLSTQANASATDGDVGDWSNALIFGQFKADTTPGNDKTADCYPIYKPTTGDTTSVDWEFYSTHVGATNRHFIHILVNSGMTVTRYTGNFGSGVTLEKTIDISTAGLTSLSESILVGTFINNSDNTFYPRGWENFGFNSLIEAYAWSTADNYVSKYELQVVKLPKASSSGATVTVDSFSGTALADNSLTTTLTITHTGATHWLINENDATPPTLADAGWATVASLPGSYTIADWVNTALYLWLKDANSVSDAYAPVNVVPNDTTAPTTPTSFSMGSATANTIDITFTAGTDAHSGIARHDLRKSSDDSLIKSSVTTGQTITGLAPGTSYTWYVEAVDEFGNTTQSSTDTLSTSSGVVGFQQDTGANDLLTIDAENYHRSTTRNNETWVNDTSHSGYVDSGAMVQSDVTTYLTSGYATNSPQLSYDVNFTSSGAHYVFVRMWAGGVSSNSCHIGIDDTELVIPGTITTGTYNQWTWTAAASIAVPSTGSHTVDLWKREPNCFIDRFVLSTNASYNASAVDSGNGPTESTEVLPGGSNAFFENGDANWLNKDDVLAELTEAQPQVYSAGTTGITISKKKFLSSIPGSHILDFPNCSNITIENCYFGTADGSHIRLDSGTSNVTIRNCYFEDNNNALSKYGNASIGINGSGDNIRVLGNYFNWCTRSITMAVCGGTSGHRFNWNFCNGVIERVDGSNPNFIGIQYSPGLSDTQVNDNVFYSPNYLSQHEDIYSNYRGGGTVNSYLQFYRNSAWGINPNTATNAVVILADVGAQGRYTCQYVHCKETVCVNTNGGIPGLTGARNCISEDNRAFNDILYPTTHYGTSIVVWRQGDCRPGDMHSNIIRNNIAQRYRDRAGVIELTGPWKPSTGNDSIRADCLDNTDHSPNHGTATFVPNSDGTYDSSNISNANNTDPEGWDTNQWTYSAWETGSPKLGYSIWYRGTDWEYAGINGDGNV